MWLDGGCVACDAYRSEAGCAQLTIHRGLSNVYLARTSTLFYLLFIWNDHGFSFFYLDGMITVSAGSKTLKKKGKFAAQLL